ncbi:3-dehydroquinate synthase [Candidatus Gracilibacteria bacterium]|nr:3-dehydroquinate synthase [Candidatus Gracilibacteria bacterium]
MKLTYRPKTEKTFIKRYEGKPISDIFEDEVFKRKKTYAIITDTNIAKIYRKELENLPEDFFIIAIDPGETSKRLLTIEKLVSKLAKEGVTRNDVVIALGGGTIGDISGFVASIYMRGIEFIQIPTTLLAMCDASIGGKNGVDTSEGKNMIGTFYQPAAIFVQPAFLKTLPGEQLRNGLAEAIKMGAIMDKSLFTFIENNYKNILKKDTKILNNIIEQCIKLKGKIVSKDMKETDLRKKLNYGHTVGHAIEKASGYSYQHGVAISMGMVLENIIALNKKITQKEVTHKITSLLKKIGLPVTTPKTIKEKARKALRSDKKRDRETITMYLPISLGKSKAYQIPLNEIERVLL